jgi:GMP synthase (glutamine-hydrolysing)
VNRPLNIVAINLNRDASTRRGIRHIIRVLSRRFSVNATECHFSRVSEHVLHAADAVILGPQGTPFDAYGAKYSTLIEVVKATAPRPTLGICGGCQAMVIADGGRIGPVSGGAATQSYSGLQKHTGWKVVRALKDDPLLPFGSVATVHVSHVEAATDLPLRYERIATSDYCSVQMIRDPLLPRWGVQFHPEYGRDGYLLLERFIEQVRKQ